MKKRNKTWICITQYGLLSQNFLKIFILQNLICQTHFPKWRKLIHSSYLNNVHLISKNINCSPIRIVILCTPRTLQFFYYSKWIKHKSHFIFIIDTISFKTAQLEAILKSNRTILSIVTFIVQKYKQYKIKKMKIIPTQTLRRTEIK